MPKSTAINKWIRYVIIALLIIVVLTLLIVIGLALLKFFPWLFREIAGLYSKAGTEFKLGLITAVLSTAGVVWSVLFQRKKELEALRFERKREVYSAFFDLLFEFMAASDSNVDLSESPETRMKFREITKKMMIWGSPSTINAFNTFQSESMNPSDDLSITFGRVEKLIRRFREDLGHKDRKLKKFALTKLIIKGDEHDQIDKM